MLADIALESAEVVAAETWSGGGRATAHHLDLADESRIRQLMDYTASRFDRVGAVLAHMPHLAESRPLMEAYLANR